MQIAKIENVTFEFLDAEFTIKELLSGDLSKIKDKTMKLSLSIEREDGEIVQNQSIETLMELERILKIKTSLVSWENVNGADGKPLACDKLGKDAFCDNLPADVFSEFATKFSSEYKQMVDALAVQRAKTVKN